MTPKNPALERNIEAIHKVRLDADKDRRRDQVWIDTIVAFAGSTTSLYVHLVFYGTWMAIHFAAQNADQFLIGAKFEDISLAATLEAIFLSIFVLINQRRMNSVERRNSDLDLQMSLLVEQEVTKIARATFLIAQKVGISSETLGDLASAKTEVKPSEVLAKISEVENKHPTHLTENPTSEKA